MGIIPFFFIIVGVLLSSVVSANEYVQFAQQKVQQAILSDTAWYGPTKGPPLSSRKSLIFIGSDLRNGGVNAVAKGLAEAITHTDWSLKFLDGHGSEIRQGAILRQAVHFRPDGIVLCGINASSHESVLDIARQFGIKVVGWHASDEAGARPNVGLFTNISTDPKQVAAMAALLAIADSAGKARVVILTDLSYSIAALKAREMAAYLQRCQDCELVSVENLPLASISQQMPTMFQHLLTSHPLTHILVINDLYIDYAIPYLESAFHHSTTVPMTISAGDGSRAAYQRILRGHYQLATVPEPLNMQGWQIVDEFNRAFHGLPPSGYSAPVHLVTKDNVSELIKTGRMGIYDPDNGYRAAYLAIWKRP